jgi:hypothetical protein
MKKFRIRNKSCKIAYKEFFEFIRGLVLFYIMFAGFVVIGILITVGIGYVLVHTYLYFPEVQVSSDMAYYFEAGVPIMRALLITAFIILILIGLKFLFIRCDDT